MSEVSEREIERWSELSPSNKILYNQYIEVCRLQNAAYFAKDGAASTGLALTRDRLREKITLILRGEVK